LENVLLMRGTFSASLVQLCSEQSSRALNFAPTRSKSPALESLHDARNGAADLIKGVPA
jgi:hypothetical protein